MGRDREAVGGARRLRLRGHFRITEMAPDLGEDEGMRPKEVPLGDIPSF